MKNLFGLLLLIVLFTACKTEHEKMHEERMRDLEYLSRLQQVSNGIKNEMFLNDLQKRYDEYQKSAVLKYEASKISAEAHKKSQKLLQQSTE